MNKTNIKKLALSGVLCAVAVFGSTVSFPVLGSRCSPAQHAVNILCAVLLGPGYGVGVAFAASLLRNIFGLGSLLAFPGSMCGALLCGLVHKKLKRLPVTFFGEVLGTGVVGGLLAWPVATAYMGQAGAVTFYAYILPFLISTTAGSVLAVLIVLALRRAGVLQRFTE